MKVNFKNLLLILLALSVPLSAAISQDKNTEKKIKVIMDDGSGAKTVIDTTLTNSPLPDSVILKNGKVIYFEGAGKEIMTEKSPGKVLVTVTSTGNNEKSKEQTVIVTSDDSTWNRKTEGDGIKHVYAYSSARSSGEKPESQTIVLTDGDNDLMTSGEKVIIIKDGKTIENDGDKTINVRVRHDDNDSESEMTKYVIAKDGVVVTVESNDEAKAKDLVKEIEEKLGVNKEQSNTKETVKAETKKTVKK
jgi:hypothetical protein